MTERVQKKGGRYYKAPLREQPPALGLVPVALQLLQSVFHAEGGDAPSVTTVLGALAKPALIGWAAREERKMVAAIAGRLYQKLDEVVGEPIPSEKFAEMLMEEAGKPANRQLLEKASNVGTQVHKRIEWTFKGELGIEREAEEPQFTSKQAERAWERWKEWRAQVKLKPRAIEKRLFSTLFGFGGTLDLLAEMEIPVGDGSPEMKTVWVVADFKTGKHIYTESFLQNIAYRMALKEEGIHVSHGVIVRLPKYEEDPEFDAKMVPDDPQLAVVFLALVIVYRWWVEQKEPKKAKASKVTAPDKEEA